MGIEEPELALGLFILEVSPATYATTRCIPAVRDLFWCLGEPECAAVEQLKTVTTVEYWNVLTLLLAIIARNPDIIVFRQALEHILKLIVAHLLRTEDVKSGKCHKVTHNLAALCPAVAILVVNLRVHTDIKGAYVERLCHCAECGKSKKW